MKRDPMTCACLVCASKPDKRYHFYFYYSSGLFKMVHSKKEDTVQLGQMRRLIWASSIRTYGRVPCNLHV